MQFFVEPIWSWPVVTLTCLGLIALVLLTYRAQLSRLSPFMARTLLTLRLMSVVVLIFAMLRPAFQKSDTDDTPVQLTILADVSRSMNTKDMPGKVSRFDAIRADLQKLEPKLKELGKQVEVRHFDFARELTAFDPTLKEGIGDQTAFGKVLEKILEESRDHRSLGLLLLTDGAQRAVPPYDIDPFTAARKLGDSQIPIYAVGYGASSLVAASLDLAIEDLRTDAVVFEKKQVPIQCKVRALGAKGKKAKVQVFLEDRMGRGLGQLGELKPVPSTQLSKSVKQIEFTRDDETIPIDLSFVPPGAGELKLAVKVEPIDPSDAELRTLNNQRETILTVKKGGLNVAYFDQLRSEQKFIRMVNGADKIQLDYQEVRAGRFSDQTRLDPSWFQRGRYDVYIIGDVRAEWFGADNLKRLDQLLENGIGLLMIGGVQNFATGGYGATPLANWLPVQMESSEYRAPGKTNPAAQISDDVKMLPTERGQLEYVMQLGPVDRNRSMWAELPALHGANRLKAKHDLVRVWATTEDKQPLLLATEVDKSRVVAFGADTTYRWCLDGRSEQHQRFWRQMILWLAKKDEDTDQPVWVRVDPRNYTPGATANLTFGARTADGARLKDAEFEIEVTRPDGKIEKPIPRQSNDENTAEFANTADPGDYWVRVTVRRKGEFISSAYTRFIVDARDLELDYPSADYDFLKELSAMSGGSSIKPEELGSQFERLKQNKFSVLTRYQVIPLWDNWVLLLIFVGLMSVEWYLRKKQGLV